MLISELTVYDFLKDKIKLSESDARRYAKELAYAEEKLRTELKLTISEEVRNGNYATKKDLKELEVKIEKGFKSHCLGSRSNGSNRRIGYCCN